MVDIDKGLKALADATQAPLRSIKDYVDICPDVPIPNYEQVLAAANRADDREWRLEASDSEARSAALTDSTLLLWLLQSTLCQLGSLIRTVVDAGDDLNVTNDANAYIRRLLLDALNPYFCECSTQGVKHAMVGLHGGQDVAQYATEMVPRFKRWNWELHTPATPVPQVSVQLGAVPPAVALLADPRTALLWNLMGWGATMLAHTVFLSLAPPRRVADHDRLVACAMASPANVPQLDSVEANARLREIQARWRSIQLSAPEDESQGDYNLWRLRARLGLLTHMARALLRMVHQVYLDNATAEQAGQLNLAHIPADYAELAQFLRQRTAHFTHVLDGKTLARLRALASSGTSKSLLLPAKQGHDHISKNVKDPKTAYGIPKLTSDQLVWESWFQKLIETRSTFDMTDIQVLHAATDHLPKDHLLLAGWPEKMSDLRDRGRDPTIADFIQNARDHLFAQSATRQIALEHIRTLLADPCAKAEDCQDLALLLQRLFRRAFPKETEEIVAVSYWNMVSLLHRVLLELHRRPPGRYHSHALVKEWRDYQWDYTRVHTDYLTPVHHGTQDQSDEHSRQYLESVCQSLQQAHRLYGQLDRTIGTQLLLTDSTHSTSTTVLTMHSDHKSLDRDGQSGPLKSALKNSLSNPRLDADSGKHKKLRKVGFQTPAVDASGRIRELNPHRNRRANRDQALGPFPTSRGNRAQVERSLSRENRKYRDPGTPRDVSAMNTAPSTGVSEGDASMERGGSGMLESELVAQTPAFPGRRTHQQSVAVPPLEMPPQIAAALARAGPAQTQVAPAAQPEQRGQATRQQHWLIERNCPQAFRIDSLAFAVHQRGERAQIWDLLNDLQENRCPICKVTPVPAQGPEQCDMVQASPSAEVRTILGQRRQWRQACIANGIAAAAASQDGYPRDPMGRPRVLLEVPAETRKAFQALQREKQLTRRRR